MSNSGSTEKREKRHEIPWFPIRFGVGKEMGGRELQNHRVFKTGLVFLCLWFKKSCIFV